MLESPLSYPFTVVGCGGGKYKFVYSGSSTKKPSTAYSVDSADLEHTYDTPAPF
jgi:hypothetical protein